MRERERESERLGKPRVGRGNPDMGYRKWDTGDHMDIDWKGTREMGFGSLDTL